jgi:hypothetical protein
VIGLSGSAHRFEMFPSNPILQACWKTVIADAPVQVREFVVLGDRQIEAPSPGKGPLELGRWARGAQRSSALGRTRRDRRRRNVWLADCFSMAGDAIAICSTGSLNPLLVCWWTVCGSVGARAILRAEATAAV